MQPLPKNNQELIDCVNLKFITQATSVTFSDLFFNSTSLVFIISGSKCVKKAQADDLVGGKGDVMVFASGSIVTLANRKIRDDNYRAVCVTFADELVREVFSDQKLLSMPPQAQVVRAFPDNPMVLLPIIEDTLQRRDLPEPILYARLLEPLRWLKHKGYLLPIPPRDESLPRKVRCLIEGNLHWNWRAEEVAEHLAMSEATMRRRLADYGQSFSRILMDSRLEKSLGLLQSSADSVSEIALDCGFKTPSHFSDAFKKRFSVSPNAIRKSAFFAQTLEEEQRKMSYLASHRYNNFLPQG